MAGNGGHYYTGIMLRALFATALLAASLSAAAQLASPYAIEHPAWFAQTFLDFREDIAEAKRDGKRLLVYFGQDGCPYCKQLMQINFTQRAIVEKTKKRFVAVALNIWGDREVQWTDGRRLSEKALTRALNIQYTPTILFLDETGGVVARLNGYYPPRRFAAALEFASGRGGKDQRFEDYMKSAAAETASPTLHEASFLRKTPVELNGTKPVTLLIETPYCSGCDELHTEGFKRADVRALLERFDVYRLTLDEARARSLQVAYTPTLVFIDHGREVFRIEAYLRPFHLASALEYVASGAYRTEPSFQRFVQARAERLRARGVAVELWK